ncbi:MAG: rod shape-determining protein MreD [Treponema sp.]|jgi:rod shape-determining protein MreD|nr:rod shape-determining protein MreD [Treponema sp.]
MVKNIIWSSIFILIAAILQSTLLEKLSIFHAVPDIALLILVYVSYVNGMMKGQLSGFIGGLFLDFFSAAPLGLNALLRTIIGALVGLFKGNFFLDYFFLPMALGALSTVMKAILLFLLHFLFAEVVPVYKLGIPTFWIELIMNTLLAPLIFAFLRLFRSILTDWRDRR